MSSDEQAALDIVFGVVNEVVERKQSDTLNPPILATSSMEKETVNHTSNG